ncbi:MAG TPA: hypothetical protein VK121_07965 [Pseudogracilibacillus sp.]|nr:hypothetical protein [Pseudogracilibacillus sp.]
MYRYTDEEIARQSFELIDNGFLIGLTSKEDLPEEINLQNRTILKAKAFLIDDIESDIQSEILERVHIVYDAEESPGDTIEFKFDDINTITVDGLEWYREELESL